VAERRRGSYDWPLKPFDRQHPVRGFLNDPRIGRGSSFHFGIDVCGADGTPVYAVAPGRVYRDSNRSVAVVGPGKRRIFGYWHIVPVVRNGDAVERHALLGRIAKGWGHVHFAERGPEGYRNPLRAGALTPFFKGSTPAVAEAGFFRRGSIVPADGVRGTVAIIADVVDTTPMAAPPPWTGLPVTPALVRWRVVHGNGAVAVPWQTAIDSRRHHLTDDRFRRVYAPRTRQNHPNAPGRFRVYLAHEWESGRFPPGLYRLEVSVADTRGNHARARVPFTITH
jgi:hypothetical protein